MVPALFFKHAHVLVDHGSEKQKITLKQNETTITFFKNRNEVNVQNENFIQTEILPVTPIELKGKIFIPFQYVTQKMGMSLLECSPPHRINLMTNNCSWNPNAFYWNGPSNKKRVALTFDDGPDRYYTPKILDILCKKNVPATFFVIGEQVGKHPELMKRMVMEGHEIGNHGFSHTGFDELTASELIQEITSTEAEIYSYTGKFSSILRPPFGLVTQPDIRIIHDLGYKSIMWTIDTRDWTGLSEEAILSIVNRELTEGAIILQHCFQSYTHKLDGTVKALPVMIENLKNEGYEIVTISKLFESQFWPIKGGKE